MYAQLDQSKYNPLMRIWYIMRGKMAENDNLNSDNLDLGDIMSNWLTTSQVVEITELNNVTSVVYAIKTGRLRGVKVGEKYRGEWRVDPASVEEFSRSNKGRKPSTDS